MVKSLILFCLSFVVFTTTQAQNSLVRNTATKSLVIESSVSNSFEDDVYQKDWNTNKFNPYSKDTILEFPFELDFTGQHFSMPIIGPTTSHYGYRRGRAHKGIDLDLVTGDVVQTVMDGKVRFAKYYSGFGNVVIVRHSNGLETLYAHLSKILVEPNQRVFSGTPIGLGGNTGKSTGSHLHFEARYKNHPINPEYLFDLEGTQLLQDNSKILVSKYWTQPKMHKAAKKSNIFIQKPVFHANTNSIQSSEKYNSLVIHSNDNSSFAKQPENYSSISKAPEVDKTLEIRNAPRAHILAPGENIRSIAEKYKTTIEKLCTFNGLTRKAQTKVGQIIYIP